MSHRGASRFLGISSGTLKDYATGRARVPALIEITFALTRHFDVSPDGRAPYSGPTSSELPRSAPQSRYCSASENSSAQRPRWDTAGQPVERRFDGLRWYWGHRADADLRRTSITAAERLGVRCRQGQWWLPG